MHELGWPVLWLVVGLLLLLVGGELLVRGASRLAVAMRISPLVIGLTVVAFGTSSPELAVSVQSALAGNADLALGNVVGSNILNILLILGASAVIVPLVVSSQLIRWDVPLMVVASVLLLLLGLDGQLGRFDGGLFVFGLVCYTVWGIRKSRQESAELQTEFAQELPTASSGAAALATQLGWILVGLVLLGVGANRLISGAVTLATHFGMSQLIIGLTIVALGTSLPEVVTSILAACRGERDIAVGNVVGSNLFNILCVLGLSSVVAPNGVTVSGTALRFDIPVMIVVAVACLPIFITGNKIARWEGILFLFYYLAYTAYLVLDATHEASGRTMARVMVFFVLPLTAITLAVTLYRALTSSRPKGVEGRRGRAD